jgi:CRISPR-associated endonuclease Cas2
MPKFLVCYDIGDTKKQNKVRKKLKDKGLHLQWSVFEVEADSAQKVKQFINEHIETYESLMVFRIKKLIHKYGLDWEEPKFRI